jgi:single-stranded-DNA-specific exonuclease
MLPKPRRWQIPPPVPRAHLERLSDLHPLIAQILCKRGITDPEKAQDFLEGVWTFNDPYAPKDMSKAVDRLRRALRTGEAIAVYGDYDVDGVTAVALLVQVLAALGGDVAPYIPHRVDEGYGLNSEALEKLAGEGKRVVVTVDCGIRAVKEAQVARRLGLDLIVTDHHDPGGEMPAVYAAINPRQADCRYPCKELAGVGLAYKLAQGLLRAEKKVPLGQRTVTLREENLLELVALGTVADMAPLRRENRALVRQGLARLNATQRPGLQALIARAGLTPGRITADSIGWTLGPRLNAAGRVDTAWTAYNLLMSRSVEEAQPLAEELEARNRERQQITATGVQEARERIMAEGPGRLLFFVAGESFQEGVVGLIAGRIVEEFYRPALVIELKGEESKGSARSIPEFHITRALDECADLLLRYGGHKAAAGFTLQSANLESLRQRLLAAAERELAGRELTPILDIDVETPLSDLDGALYNSLQRLEPCGTGNPTPLFLSRGVKLREARPVGSEGQHLKLNLSDSRNVTWDGIGFGLGGWAEPLQGVEKVDLVYTLEANEWDGQERLQLNVRDLRPS